MSDGADAPRRRMRVDQGAANRMIAFNLGVHSTPSPKKTKQAGTSPPTTDGSKGGGEGGGKTADKTANRNQFISDSNDTACSDTGMPQLSNECGVQFSGALDPAHSPATKRRSGETRTAPKPTVRVSAGASPRSQRDNRSRDTAGAGDSGGDGNSGGHEKGVSEPARAKASGRPTGSTAGRATGGSGLHTDRPAAGRGGRGAGHTGGGGGEIDRHDRRPDVDESTKRRRVYVGNLTPACDVGKLQDFIAQTFGPVSVNMLSHKESHVQKGYAVATFQTEMAAMRCLTMQ
jgi:hypothetical protein